MVWNQANLGKAGSEDISLVQMAVNSSTSYRAATSCPLTLREKAALTRTTPLPPRHAFCALATHDSHGDLPIISPTIISEQPLDVERNTLPEG